MCETLPALFTSFSAISRRQLTREYSNQSSDDDLIGATLGGDCRAYEILLRRYQKLVYNVLYQMLQSHESSADATQDTFVRAYKGLSSFRRESPFKPWLLRIATNCGLNKIREAKLREHDSLDDLLDENSSAEPASSDNVEAQVELRLSHQKVAEALNKLPARHRHIFLLRYQHDLSYEDIAQIAGESETNVKSLLFRTRERLRKLLREREPSGAKD